MRRTVFEDKHESFRLVVRKFVTDEIVPAYEDWERAGRPSRQFWRRAGELGILGIGVPTEFGGLGDSTFTHSVVVTEEIQKEFLALGAAAVLQHTVEEFVGSGAGQHTKFELAACATEVQAGQTLIDRTPTERASRGPSCG